MRRTLSIWFAVVLAAMSVACSGCKIPTPVDEPTPQQDTTTVEPADLSLIKLTVPVTDDWVWSGKPQITINIDNPNAADVTVGTKIKITTDSKKDVETLTDSVTIPGKSSYEFVVTTTNQLDPGFYRAQCMVNGKTHKSFVFGIDPFKIVSLPDKQPDYDQFWQAAKDQLAAIDMNARLTEITQKSSATRKVYLVEMNSVPDGLEGEPVTIRGYYCEPQDGQPHPVIMHFYGYDTQGSKAKCECPSGGSSTNAEFYLSHRGQYLNNRPASTGNPGITEDCVNIYGDWFSYNFGDKDSWYYRGAYMDVVQAVRFMATRETSDMSKLFAEGSRSVLRRLCGLHRDRRSGSRDSEKTDEKDRLDQRGDAPVPVVLRHQEPHHAHLVCSAGFERSARRCVSATDECSALQQPGYTGIGEGVHIRPADGTLVSGIVVHKNGSAL